MAGDCKQFSRCSHDKNDCLQLSSVLHAFSTALSEERAWAVCFQSAKCMMNEWNLDRNQCYCLSDTSHIYIHKDGYVHRSTVRLASEDVGNRQLAETEHQLVSGLGLVIFHILDYMLPADEERILSEPLEALIQQMTSLEATEQTDEGIGGEDDDTQPVTLRHVMELCASHLECAEQADGHYRAVCRALVAEVLELTTFLERISNNKEILGCCSEDEIDGKALKTLKIQDWARLWMQVIQELRQGVQLKKVLSHHAHSIEYALTPYEMLLDDIRARKYKLKQVMVNGDIPPRVKKDAHALILEFIRSRPPLVPVSRRQIPPTPPKQLTLYEKLMASIKQQHTLRPTPNNSPKRNKIAVSSKKSLDQPSSPSPQPQRRLIKLDLNLHLSSSCEDLDDFTTTPLEDSTHRNSSSVQSISHTNGSRRHSFGCSTPDSSSFYQQSSRAAKADYWKTSQWQSLEFLSLTLEEIVHIRSVLTKAELESLLVEPQLHQDLAKGKVCFTCKQVRFSFFGPWGVKCKMCERTVCDSCSSKMRIPREHFARIPVYMLSPSPSPPPQEQDDSFWSNFTKSEMKENVPTTPKLSRQKTTVDDAERKKSMPAGKKRAPLSRAKTIAPSHAEESGTEMEELMKGGPLVPVCRECKVLVRDIILTSRESRAAPPRRALAKLDSVDSQIAADLC